MAEEGDIKAALREVLAESNAGLLERVTALETALKREQGEGMSAATPGGLFPEPVRGLYPMHVGVWGRSRGSWSGGNGGDEMRECCPSIPAGCHDSSHYC